MLNRIRKFSRNIHFIRKFIAYTVVPSGLFDRFIINYQLDKGWIERNNIVLESSDNEKIPRVPNAGTIKNGKQLMHNGLKINLGSYYGPEVTRLLLDNKGVHEPQEELAFMQLLPFMKEGAVMIEMGAFWGFYSMWFQQVVPLAKNYLIEPDKFNMESGRRNFQLNHLKGNFFNYFIGDKTVRVKKGTSTICIDDFIVEQGIDFVDLLHSDIQGFEGKMLEGASMLLQNQRVGYIFISTHSDELHYQCIAYLQKLNFHIVASADMKQSFSLDGLIVAKNKAYPGPDVIDISLRK